MAQSAKDASKGLDVERIRSQFPILQRRVHGKPLVYLDSANTAQKPQAVIDAVDNFYREHNANVARAVHTLGAEATELYEAARRRIAAFIGAPAAELVLTSGTTQAINLVAWSFVAPKLKPGDVVLTTQMEHHANIVPWQLVCERAGARLVAVDIDDRGVLDLDDLDRKLDGPVALLAVTHVSNVLGTINPVADICRRARRRGVPVLVDGSQALPHLPVDVTKLGCDFYAFTGHKLFGPTGTGGLWARAATLAAMPPFFGGGEMIETVSFAGTTFAAPPHRFEAGTPNIAGFIGLAAAVDWLAGLTMEAVQAHEAALAAYSAEALQAVEGLRLIGTAPHRVGVFSFLVDGAHAHDLATLLDLDGIAVRSGHHCAHPLMQRLGIASTCRASLSVYNTATEVDQLVAALGRCRSMLA